MRMKLLVLYHSGVGNTKLIANRLNSKLKQTYVTDLFAVEEIGDDFSFKNYDGYVIGFPTCHTHPSDSILKFINSIDMLKRSKPAYIFTTCGWFSANTLRIFARLCLNKNIIPVLHQSYRCPATDGTLVAPYIKALFSFEKGLTKKIDNDVEKIKTAFEGEPSANLPRFKLISLLNYPNKKIGQLITLKIFLHKDKCIKCGKCIENCIMNAMNADEENYPVFTKEKCEKCYRCIHHCPNKALSLSKRKAPKKLLTEESLYFGDKS